MGAARGGHGIPSRRRPAPATAATAAAATFALALGHKGAQGELELGHVAREL